jgi:hypothetical protein
VTFVKNNPKPENSGKKKGSKNKATLLREQLKISSWAELSAFMEKEGLKRFVQEMNDLKGKDFVTAYNTLLEYVKPKLTRTEHQGQIQSIQYNVDLTKEEIKEITQSFENDF